MSQHVQLTLDAKSMHHMVVGCVICRSCGPTSLCWLTAFECPESVGDRRGGVFGVWLLVDPRPLVFAGNETHASVQLSANLLGAHLVAEQMQPDLLQDPGERIPAPSA